MKIELGFKVVAERNGKYYSMITWPEIEYKQEEWTFPASGSGPLTVFSTMKAAQKVLSFSIFSTYIVKQCLYLPSKETAVWTPFSSKKTVIELEWDNPTLIIPRTVCLADKVLIF